MKNDNRKGKILCDLDAVLCNTPRTIGKWAKEMFNVGPGDLPYTETIFNIEDAWPDINFQMMKKFFHRKDFWESIPLFSMATNFTKQLGEWSEVHIVTDRNWYPELEEETRQWLLRNNLYFDKLAIVKGTEKYKYCEENGITVAIEDKPANILLLSNVVPVVVMAWPYNIEKCTGINNVAIAYNYYEAVKTVELRLGLTQDTWQYPQSVDRLCEQ